MISVIQSLRTDPDRLKESIDRGRFKADSAADPDGGDFPFSDQAVNGQRLDGQLFGQRFDGKELFGFHWFLPYMAKMAASMSDSLKLRYWTVELIFL